MGKTKVDWHKRKTAWKAGRESAEATPPRPLPDLNAYPLRKVVGWERITVPTFPGRKGRLALRARLDCGHTHTLQSPGDSARRDALPHLPQGDIAMKNHVTNTTREMNGPIATLGLLMGGGSGAIEASEACGQRELVKSDVLPANVTEPDLRPLLERLGFTIGAPVEGDALFVYATLPPGWKKEGSDHAMHSSILDDQGRERVHLFYKAAYYDRKARASLVGRYDVDACDKQDYLRDDAPWKVTDRKTGAVVHEGTYDACRAFCRPFNEMSAVDQWEAP